MGREKVILLILLPAMLAGQNGELSEAARKLLSRPRLDNAQLTLSNGRKENGWIVRVTDQFITLATNQKPLSCEDVELSKVAAVHWLPTPKNNLLPAIAFWTFLSPFLVADAIAGVFRSPPLQPLRGNWESDGSRLEFGGSTVKGWATTVRTGHYSVPENQLHVMFDGTPETVTPFRFNCGQLVLDHPSAVFSWRPTTNPASAPIVGEWHGHSSTLNLKKDGLCEERKEEVRYGTFERTMTGVNIHWADDQGPGGPEWSAQIMHRHIVVRIGNVVTEYRYVPPSALDL